MSSVTVPDSIIGKIENVVDEREQIRAGGMDGLRVLDLVSPLRLLAALSASRPRQEQQAVQRGAQLVDMLARNSDL